MIKTNFRFGEVNKLAEQISPKDEKPQVASIFGNDCGCGVSLVGLAAGQMLDTHVAPVDVMVYVVAGQVTFRLAGEDHYMDTGDFMLVGQGVEHSVKAELPSKIMLVKINPQMD